MSLEDVYRGAKNVFAVWGAFGANVANELGWEKTLELYGKTIDQFGSMMGQMMKQQMAIEELDAETAPMIAKTALGEYGIDFDMEAGPSSVQFNVKRCPVYDGHSMAGIDEETKANICRNGPVKFLDAIFKQFNPDASMHLKEFRTSPEECCIEELTWK